MCGSCCWLPDAGGKLVELVGLSELLGARAVGCCCWVGKRRGSRMSELRSASVARVVSGWPRRGSSDSTDLEREKETSARVTLSRALAEGRERAGLAWSATVSREKGSEQPLDAGAGWERVED